MSGSRSAFLRLLKILDAIVRRIEFALKRLGYLQTFRAERGSSQRRFLSHDKLLLEYTLAEPVAGKIGVWSKTGSISYCDDFVVTSRNN
jgi:hypothetical protein